MDEELVERLLRSDKRIATLQRERAKKEAEMQRLEERRKVEEALKARKEEAQEAARKAQEEKIAKELDLRRKQQDVERQALQAADERKRKAAADAGIRFVVWNFWGGLARVHKNFSSCPPAPGRVRKQWTIPGTRPGYRNSTGIM